MQHGKASRNRTLACRRESLQGILYPNPQSISSLQCLEMKHSDGKSHICSFKPKFRTKRNKSSPPIQTKTAHVQVDLDEKVRIVGCEMTSECIVVEGGEPCGVWIRVPESLSRKAIPQLLDYSPEC